MAMGDMVQDGDRNLPRVPTPFSDWDTVQKYTHSKCLTAHGIRRESNWFLLSVQRRVPLRGRVAERTPRNTGPLRHLVVNQKRALQISTAVAPVADVPIPA
jgi:hypothetical protein